MADCETTGDIQAKLKRLFAGIIEQMLEAEMDEHLSYEKNYTAGNNLGKAATVTGQKQKPAIMVNVKMSVSRNCNGEYKPKVIEKRQIRTDEVEQIIMTMYAKV